MDWTSVGEVVKVIGAVATGGSAIFATCIAYRGLEKWRSETVGRRRYDVAVATLTLFYEMDEILRSVRMPWVLPHEMALKEGIPDKIATDANFAPEARLQEHQDFFAKVRTARHEFAAIFGKTAAIPFDEIWNVRLQINHAVEFMLTHKDVRDSRRPDDRKLWEQQYRIAFRSADSTKDEVAGRIAAQVEVIETICRPVMAERIGKASV